MVLIIFGCTEDKIKTNINVENKTDSFDLEEDLKDTDEDLGSLDDLEILVDENTFK